MKTPRTSKEEWREHVRAWQASSLTSKAYAAQAGLNANSLTWWKWRLHKDEAGKPKRWKKGAKLEFVELHTSSLIPPVVAASPLELDVGGVLLRLPSDFNADALTRALDVLEARR